MTAARPVRALTEAQRRWLAHLNGPIPKFYAETGLTAHPIQSVNVRICDALARRGFAECIVERATAGAHVECYRITPAAVAELGKARGQVS